MDNQILQKIKLRYGIVGNCISLNRAIETSLKIAPVDISVLVVGENGVGKEIFPRIIHDHSLRKGKKYFAVNCGAIPEGTIDSELFGHEKGAFTGAVDRREGYFATANGGTLFLDEVGELPLPTQARLLRVLETGEFIPVGASEVRKTDVRIVAATNVDMERAVGEGKFREDLYYRLNAVTVAVPPLRDRGGDIALLFKKFALDMSEKYKMPPIRLKPEAVKLLTEYSWPGNVRQLKNIAENLSITSDNRDISADILRSYLPQSSHNSLVVKKNGNGGHSFENERDILYQILFDLRRDVNELKKTVAAGTGTRGNMNTANDNASTAQIFNGMDVPKLAPQVTQASPTKNTVVGSEDYAEAEDVTDKESGTTVKVGKLEDMEKEMIKQALCDSGGNRRVAANKLGISERTLYRKIKEYGME